MSGRAAGRPVLCLHGFTGTPFDTGALASALEADGYAVEAPLLPGHGAAVADLAHATAADWLAAAERSLSSLADRTGMRVALVGASMGGLLAVRLGRRRPEAVAALVLMAAPFRWGTIERRGVEALASLASALGVSRASIPKSGGVDVIDPEVRAVMPSIDAYPLAALKEFMALTEAAAAELPSVTAPTLIVHGRLDRTVPPTVSDDVARTIGAEVVERLWAENSGHLVAIDVDRAAVAKGVSAFLAQRAIWDPLASS